MESDNGARSFQYSFSCGSDGQTLTLQVPVNVEELKQRQIPEFCARIINFHKLPCFVEAGLVKTMKNFVFEELTELKKRNSSVCIEMVRKNPQLIPEMAKVIADKYRKSCARFAESRTNVVDEFPLAYHYLIHSAAMQVVLKLETKYHSSLSKLISYKEQCLTKMQERQQLEMTRMCENVGFAFSNQDVTELASKHLEDVENLISQLDSEYDATLTKQNKEFREAVINLSLEMKRNNNEIDESGPAYNEVKRIINESSSVSTLPRNSGLLVEEDSTSRLSSPNVSSITGSSGILMEESFTINLGAQLKTMHNVRLLVTDILNFCQYSDEREAEAQRFQSAMSLYSNSLSAMVILTDKRLGYKSGIQHDFSKICLSSNEFHFDSLNEQLRNIEHEVVKYDKDGKSDLINQEEGYVHLNEGDFYITKHSNLSQVHAVFHLAVDESALQAKASSVTVTSRHPVIISLRQILKVCSRHDIGTLTLPLLLTHELTEEITFQWCIKRAELVMKCIKGFMMEMATWDGGVSRTIQFVLPPGISEEAFDRMRSTLPEVFRTTSTRDLTRARSSR